MTKANLISNINGFIISVVNVTKHRNSMLSLINELYPTVIYESYNIGSGTRAITSGTNANISYGLRFTKTGNQVNVVGRISNTTAIAINSQVLFNISNAEYISKTANDTTFKGINQNNNGSALLSFATSSLFLIDNIPAFTSIQINTTYLTND